MLFLYQVHLLILSQRLKQELSGTQYSEKHPEQYLCSKDKFLYVGRKFPSCTNDNISFGSRWPKEQQLKGQTFINCPDKLLSSIINKKKKMYMDLNTVGTHTESSSSFTILCQALSTCGQTGLNKKCSLSYLLCLVMLWLQKMNRIMPGVLPDMT